MTSTARAEAKQVSPPPGSTTDKANLTVWPHEPWTHGYLSKDLAAWSSDTDTFAKYLRSRVPLAKRIPAFPATQADPRLVQGPQVIELSEDYVGKMDCRGLRYSDDVTLRTSRFWQYTDIFGAWHGVITETSPLLENLIYGVVNLPNPAWTDVAHRNGVKSIGCWYWPRTDDFSRLVVKNPDGSFPVADRLLAMAAYFGFDGYFINQEGDVDAAYAAALMEMFTYMRAKSPGFLMQYYDAMLPGGDVEYQNQFDEENAPWIRNGDTPVCDSMFVNYGWHSDECTSSRTYAQKLGLDPYKVVYMGTECAMRGFDQAGYDPRNNFPEGGSALNSWALFESTAKILCPPNVDLHDPGVQARRYAMERYFWSGPKADPTKTGRLRPPEGGDPYNNYEVWDGVAHYITERSVIGGFPFITCFNTGKGFGFWKGGKQTGTAQWANAGVADILPTWQWWITSQGASPPLTVDYDSAVAWDGGASLKVVGRQNVGDNSVIRLFKTRLNVSTATTVRIRYNAAGAGSNLGLSIGLIFEDSPAQPTYGTVGKTYTAGWNTETLPLGSFAGRTIAAISLRFAAPASTLYNVNIGELAFLDGAPISPLAPASFAIDASYPYNNIAEVLLSWTLDPGMWYYDIGRVRPDGSVEPLGRTFDDVFYVKQVARVGTEPSTTIRLTAVSRTGTEGPPATATLQWPRGGDH